LFLTLQNLSLNFIRLNTNIDKFQILSLNLFNVFGEKVKSYGSERVNDDLDISDISSGMYFLQLVSSTRQAITIKFIKQTP